MSTAVKNLLVHHNSVAMVSDSSSNLKHISVYTGSTQTSSGMAFRDNILPIKLIDSPFRQTTKESKGQLSSAGIAIVSGSSKVISHRRL